MSQQDRNAELVSLLETDFVGRNEPSYAWKSACSACLALPGLRGFWPMSSFNEAGNAYDLSGQGRIASYNGNPLYGYENLVQWINFDGVGDYLNRGTEAGLDILGTESYVTPAYRGLTLGGWFYVDQHVTGGDGDGLIAKITYINDYSYGLITDNTPNATFLISSTGAVGGVQSISETITYQSWYFIVGRFIPSTELKVWVNATQATLAVGVAASIFNSAADLEIGAYNTGANLTDGKASLVFLCATAVSDPIINALYQSTRGMFGV